MRRLVFICGVALLAKAGVLAAGDWRVPEAPLRYKVALARKPAPSTSGYYVHLPDGGILRGTTPTTVVMTDDGKTIPSFLLWHNSETGFSIVFADPGAQAKSVNVYTVGGRLPNLWRPESGLMPGAILCAFPGRDNLGAAQALGKFGHVERPVHSWNDDGVPKAPFSIGGDNDGHPKPAAFYLLSHVEAAVAGKYWFAPFVRTGQCDVVIDGNKLNPKEQSKKWGGNGAFVELTKGAHRVEVFQTAPGGGPYSTDPKEGGLMYLTWRPPNEELKGVESRVLKSSEIARSGACHLTAVEARDGAPVAAATVHPGLCYWFENEEPLVIYDLDALTAGQPAGTTYTWSFPDKSSIDGAKVQWLVPGFRETKLKLTAKSGQGSSSCNVSFFGFSTAKTSLENPAHREAFRSVLAKMLEAFPRNDDPVADWTPAWWNNLLRTVEGGEGYPLLQRLFTDHLEAARKKLTAGQLHPLEDLFLDLTVLKDPAATPQWLQKFQPGLATSPRQNELKLREGESQMYYLGDRKAAEKIFAALTAIPGEFGERARIRLGDLALIEGDLNKATALYADVQNRARTRRNSAPGGMVADQLVQGGTPRAAESTSLPLPFQNSAKPAGGPDQKRGALQEVSLSENARTLIDQDFLLEARQALLAWEIEFPLSKISGDYILRESALYIKMQDWKHARPLLEAYCREIDASSFLPDAATMLITCVKGAKEPPDSIRDIIEKVKGRLKYHPVAAELDTFLSTTGPKPK